MQFGLFQLQYVEKQSMAQAVLEHELSEHSECSHGRSQVQSDGPSTVTPESSQMSKVFANIWRGLLKMNTIIFAVLLFKRF